MAIRRASSSRARPRKWRKELRRAVRLEAGPAGSGFAVEHRADLGQHALPPASHRSASRSAPAARPASGRQQDRREPPGRRLALGFLPVAERPAGRLQTSQARTWRWRSPGFRRATICRIAFGQPRAEGLGAHRVPFRVGLVAQLGAARREWRRCPASARADKGPSRRTGWAAPSPAARSRPTPARASARPTGSRSAAARRRARAAPAPAPPAEGCAVRIGKAS